MATDPVEEAWADLRPETPPKKEPLPPEPTLETLFMNLKQRLAALIQIRQATGKPYFKLELSVDGGRGFGFTVARAESLEDALRKITVQIEAAAGNDLTAALNRHELCVEDANHAHEALTRISTLMRDAGIVPSTPDPDEPDDPTDDLPF
jgi:hypothetical protein